MLSEECRQPLSLRPRACRGGADGTCEQDPGKTHGGCRTHACNEGIDTGPQCGSQPAFVPRMVNVVGGNNGRSSQQLLNIEHALAVVAPAHKGMLDCMEEAPRTATVNQAAISRVLGEDRRMREIVKTSALSALRSPRQDVFHNPRRLVRMWGRGLTPDPILR